jgi:hypothetical protein
MDGSWVRRHGLSGPARDAVRRELGVKRHRVGAADFSPDFGHPVLAGADIDVAVGVALSSHAYRVGVGDDDQPVDQLGDLLS